MSEKDSEQRSKPPVKDDLERYQERKQLIASYKAELDEDLMTTDTVVGSMAEFPYTERVVTIQGIDEKRALELQKKIYGLEEQCTRAEAFVAGVADEYMRALLYWHYLKGLSWPKVRKTLRRRDVTTDALRMRTERFFAKTLECSHCSVFNILDGLDNERAT